MVKGISRQVIVIQSPKPELFEQAIFILNDKAPPPEVTQDGLLLEAKRILKSSFRKNDSSWKSRLLWASLGAAISCSVCCGLWFML